MKINNELKNEVLRERTNCGMAEYEVVLNRATTANDGKTPTSPQIIEALDEWRKQFSLGTVSGAAGTYATEETWKRIYAESEKAAREELLSSSEELRTLTALEKEAVELQRKARAQEEKLNAWFNEYSNLPNKALSANDRLARVSEERKALGGPLDAEFNEAYTALACGNLQFTAKVAQLTSTIATRELRLQILKRIEAEANAELAKLEVRNKELAKLLGRPRHKLA
jgi:hypothetical protein